MHIAAAERCMNALIPAIQQALQRKRRREGERICATWSRSGARICRMPCRSRWARKWRGWASLLARDISALRQSLRRLYDLAIGGTAVGTGLNTHPEFAARAAAISRS